MWAVHTDGSTHKRTWKKEASALGLLAFALVGKRIYAVNLGTLTVVLERGSLGLPTSSSRGALQAFRTRLDVRDIQPYRLSS